MKIKENLDGRIIILSEALDNRAKILNLIYFVLLTSFGIFFIKMPLKGNTLNWGIFTFIVIASGGYLFAAYRFVNKALQKEKLILNKNTLTISRSGFLTSKKDIYEVNQISNFRHLDKPEITKHPLAGQSFDYFGFQTEQEVINEMLGDNRLAFDYNNKTIKFGENIYSWDYEKLLILIQEITGKYFSNKEVDVEI